MPYSDNPLNQFNQDGYLLIPSLFDQQEVSGLLHYAKADQQLVADSHVRKDATGGDTRLTVQNDLVEDSPYSAVARAERIVSRMQQLLGDEVYHYHHKMMLKEPRVGGAWEWHQDYGYWYNHGCLFPDMASCLIAVDQATRANGCLQVLKGSHRLGRINHTTAGKQQGGEQQGADPERVEAAIQRFELVHCEMQPGDALFFHANLLHRSDKNQSDHARWSLICCYNTRHNDPIIQGGRHGNYSPLEMWPDDRVRQLLTKQCQT